jgi:hypothetical protein
MKRRTFLKTTAASAGLFTLSACGGSDVAADMVAVNPPVTSSPPPPTVPTPPPPSTSVTASITSVGSPVVMPPAPGPLPAWVASLPLWTWYEIPNTALASVEPAIRPLGWTGPRSKIDTWNGAALKREGSIYILGAAGGHADYAGNEVNAIQLNSTAPQWIELRGPTRNSDIVDRTQFYLDLRPSSTHSYYATQFINPLNRMVVFASQGIYGQFPVAPADFPYRGDRRSFSFDMARNDWDSPDFIAQFPGTGDTYAAFCVKHPWTDDVYYSRNSGDGWYRWTHSSNSWVKLSTASRAPWYAGAAIDPKRNRMLIVGSYSPTAPEVRDLNGHLTPVNFGGLGAAVLTASGYPGVVYDEVNDTYLSLMNSGGTIRTFRIDADSFVVDEPRTGGPTPVARTNGIMNSVQYVPELRGIVIANAYRGNVLFMRTAN